MQNAVPNDGVERPSMNPKTIGKIVVDSLMTVLLMAQMGRQFWSDVAHEWIAVGISVLFIAHHVLNLNWYKTMFKGKYTPYRTLQLIIDVLVFVPMIGLMVSGIMLSQHVLVFFPITGGTSFARILHMLATYWGFVLMALHLGFHWSVFISMARKATKTTQSSPSRTTLLGLVGTAIALYGLYVFINRDLLSYMLLQNLFVFLDYGESRVLVFLDYLAMMGLFVWIGHNVKGLLRERSASKRRQRTGGSDQTVGRKYQIEKPALFVLTVTMMFFSLRACGGNAPRTAMEPNGVATAPAAPEATEVSMPEPNITDMEPTAFASVPESPVATETGTSEPNITATEPNIVADALESPVAMEVDMSESTLNEIEVPEGFVLIKGGTFDMGSPDSEAWRGDDETEHTVTVSDFYMSIHEVTQEEYQEIMGSNPSTFYGDNLPVENVTWFDAIAL